MGAKVEVVAYDPAWPAMYEAEAAQLRPIIGEALIAIYHVGSTAVPGLDAKPVIDLSVEIRSLADAPALIPHIEALGYDYRQHLEAIYPERRYFQRLVDGVHTHHIHITEPDSVFTLRMVRFRDRLRQHDYLRDQYAALKHELAARFAHDRAAYNNNKTEFIEMVLADGI